VTSDRGSSVDAEGEVLPPGTEVLVRTRFDGRWAAGFQIADVKRRGVVPPAYRIRRRSDHAVLPGLFPRAELRQVG
jgi:hypothetical protein